MKKIILFLALLSLGVSKAQVVGGYLPVNSTKSATMGGLRVNGNETVTGTFSLGSANLTGGNTGTVAVLSDAVFSIQHNGVSHNPADGLNYYYGTWNQNNSGYLQGGGRVYLPYNCRLVAWTNIIYVNGVLGSAETSTISLLVDGTTATTLTTAGSYTLDKSNILNGSGLSVDVNGGSYIETRFLTPNWVTNPTTVSYSTVYYFIRRQ